MTHLPLKIFIYIVYLLCGTDLFLGPKPPKKKTKTFEIMNFMHEKHSAEMKLKEEELELKNKQLEFEKMKFEVEKQERQARMESEAQERRAMLNLIQSLVGAKNSTV